MKTSGDNMKAPLRIINIAPLSTDHQEEICSDLQRLHKECGITDVAFMLPLHPEEPNPTMAKPEYLRDLFVDMKNRLASSGLQIGILMQSTLGHGTPSQARFARSINAKGMTTDSMCPLDPGLQDYIEKAVTTVAASKPEFLILDDDFRLANYGAPGCFCELHMKAIEKATGRKFDRQSLLKSLEEKTSEALQLQKIWEQVKLDSLLVLARKIRVGIDSADRKLACGFCICDAGGMELQYAHAIEATVAGGNPQFVRVNNAMYWNNDAKVLLPRLYWSSAQMQIMKDMPEILAESDTYPHNRYATPASALDTQIIFALANGCTGLKLWITRLGTFEPASGQAYRQLLKRKIRAYRELRTLARHIQWTGPTVPLCNDISEIPAGGNPIRNSNWSSSVLGHMGIPCCVGFNSESSVFMLTGPEIEKFSDDQLKAFLSKGVLLDGSAAQSLSMRGLSEFVGVEADAPQDWKANVEFINNDMINGKAKNKEFHISSLSRGDSVRLTPLAHANVKILSTICTIPFYISPNRQEVGSGLVLFENSLGGRVATFASSLGYTPFMHETRREQLVGVLGWLHRKPLPMVVDSDIDIFTMHGSIDTKAGGGELLVIFNLNIDSLDNLTLRLSGGDPTKILILKDDGNWENRCWRKGDASSVILETRLESAVPIVLKIQRRTEQE